MGHLFGEKAKAMGKKERKGIIVLAQRRLWKGQMRELMPDTPLFIFILLRGVEKAVRISVTLNQIHGWGQHHR
jgi:hypothetical protein